jgi:hypothetical protein
MFFKKAKYRECFEDIVEVRYCGGKILRKNHNKNSFGLNKTKSNENKPKKNSLKLRETVNTPF